MKNITIKGCGYALAKHCIHNQDLEKIVDTSDAWITTRTGIKTRYVSVEENTSDLAYRASLKAIEEAKIDKKEIDLIVVATMSGDCFTPSTACILQEKLGLSLQHVMAFDINAACSGFVYGMQIVSALLKQYHCALLVGAETLSKLVDWQDRSTCILFGDGAGAMILKKEETNKQMHYFAQSIPDFKKTLYANGIAMHSPLINATKEYGYLQMEGQEVFRFAIKAIEDGILQVLKESKKTLEEIDLIIPHQANIRILKHVSKKMKIKEDKIFTNIDKVGNTSAASIAIAFAQAKEEGKLKEGMKVILVGFGAGLTYASAYVEL